MNEQERALIGHPASERARRASLPPRRSCGSAPPSLRAGFDAVFCAGMCCGETHGWAEVPLAPSAGRLLVDLTAKQFRARWARVLILLPGAPRRAHYRLVYEGERARRALNAAQLRALARLPVSWRV